jgi:hypothetical protein
MGMKAQLAPHATVRPTASEACVNSRGTSAERAAAFVGRIHDERGRVTVHDSSGDVLDTRAY